MTWDFGSVPGALHPVQSDWVVATVVLTNHAINVTKRLGFNLFIVNDRHIVMLDLGMLGAITWQTAIGLCSKLGIPVTAALENDDVALFRPQLQKQHC